MAAAAVQIALKNVWAHPLPAGAMDAPRLMWGVRDGSQRQKFGVWKCQLV